MDSSLFQTIALLFVGWLLGLLGPIVTEAIKRRRENATGRKAILAELHDTAFKLLTAAYAVDLYRGSLTHESLNKFQRLTSEFEKTNERLRFEEISTRIMSYSPEQLAAFTQAAKSEPGRGAVLQKYAIPLLDSRVSALWSFETAFTRELLDIRVGIDLLNDIVDRSRKYSDMTFQELSQFNRMAANKNIDESYDLYGERASKLVSQISTLRVL